MNNEEATVCIAWNGRIQLQRAGLATEAPATFQEKILEAIKKEKSPEVRWALSRWSPEKDTPGRMYREGESLWKKKLKSHDKQTLLVAALALLGPAPTSDFIGQREKLLNILTVLPEKQALQLSIAEITHLMGELPSGDLNADLGEVPDRRWQFRPDEMRFRVPAERTASVAASAGIQTVCPDRTAQRIAGTEPQRGRYC